MDFFVKILQIRKEKCYNDNHQIWDEFIKREGDYMENAIDLAKYIISYYNKTEKNITNLKLQKILYYIQGYSLKFLHYSAFNSKICNWPYGPVVEDVYFEFNEYGGRNIILSDENIVKPKKALYKIVLLIIQKCSNISAFELVEKTHSETPWQITERGDYIPIECIHDYFSKNNPLDISYGD